MNINIDVNNKMKSSKHTRTFGTTLNVQNLISQNNGNGVCKGEIVTKRPQEHNSPLKKGPKRSKLDSKENEENIEKSMKASKSLDLNGDVPKSIELKVRSISLNCDSPPSDGESNVTVVRILEKPERDGVNFENPATYYVSPNELPCDIVDFDKTQVNDLTSEPHCAHDVFDYDKKKEIENDVKVTKYMHNQPELTKPMRAVLVDWMVEVQESFELNHETLHLAVKLVDHYLSKKVLTKNKFQLLGATCLLIAAKFDQRIPPAIEDFLYICDDAYKRRDITLMEVDVLRKLKFFIGFPISYRFLRRYARCAKLSMEALTLSRFILESSLLEYDLIDERDSKLAAAALLLALKMKQQTWNNTLAFYSTYKEEELHELAYRLNDIISAPVRANVKTIRTKYSHRIFFEVAKISPLPKK